MGESVIVRVAEPDNAVGCVQGLLISAVHYVILFVDYKNGCFAQKFRYCYSISYST